MDIIQNVRDEFTPNDVPAVFNQGEADSLFDQCFERTFRVPYLCGDFKQFKAFLETGDGERPALLVCWDGNPSFRGHARALVEHLSAMDVFDIYYSSYGESKRLFSLEKRGAVRPFLCIVDKGEREMLGSALGALEPDEELRNWYWRKYTLEALYLSDDDTWLGQVDTFTDQFLDQKLDHDCYTQPRRH